MNKFFGGYIIKSDCEETNLNELFMSILIASFLGMLLSHNLSIYLTEPLMRDQSLFTGSRYTITVDALNTIAEDDTISVIAIGSSMTYKGIDGGCIGDFLGDDVMAYFANILADPNKWWICSTEPTATARMMIIRPGDWRYVPLRLTNGSFPVVARL